MQVKAKHTHLKRLDGVVVLRPKGNLLGPSEATEELEQLFTELNAEGVGCLVLNLADVGLMNTPGYLAIVRGHKKFAERGARLRLCELTRKVQAMFVILKLGLMIPTSETEEKAVASCASD